MTSNQTKKMKRGAVDGDKAELIKWFDVLDKLTDWRPLDIDSVLQMARECQHPDAQWLAALFPAGTHVTPEGMREVMLQQGDDPRALYFASRLVRRDVGLLRRATEGGFARAQADLAALTENTAEKLRLLEKASEQNDREGLFQLGELVYRVDKDVDRAIELYWRAAELDQHDAQFEYGDMAFGERDWERFHWWSKAADGGVCEGTLCCHIADFLPCFERGECGRILGIAAPVIKKNLEEWKEGDLFLMLMTEDVLDIEDLECVLELHAEMLRRARGAIDCWSMAGRRCGVVKDMRMMIAKMLWAEAWRWGDSENVEHEKKREEGNKKAKRL
jgi:tetratricopeptide (TPR) repeat protein